MKKTAIGTLCPSTPLVTRKFEVTGSLLRILTNTISKEQTLTISHLSISIALIGCQLVVTRSLFKILQNTISKG